MTTESASSPARQTARLSAAVGTVPDGELKAALGRAPVIPPTAVAARNAWNALRRHRTPGAVLGRPQYRAALPYVAASIADECLTRTIEVLGDHSDDPTRVQLVEALDTVAASFPTTTVAVMLASVAADDLPASPLCAELLNEDPRYGLTEVALETSGPSGPGPRPMAGAAAASPAQRAARKEKKKRERAVRRRQAEVAARADRQVRDRRKEERARTDPAYEAHEERSRPAVPRTTRRAVLTPAEEAEFDREHPWVSGVVFAWVPYDTVDPSEPDLAGKARRCVVVAGSPTHLLVRPGYSVAGQRGGSWKAVALRDWRAAGFERPTAVDVHAVRVPRPEGAPVGWLTPADWNALW